MFGFSSIAEVPFAALPFVASPTPYLVVDYGDGDKRRKKHWKREQLRDERRRSRIVEAYERLVEGKPEVAARITAPYIAPVAAPVVRAAAFPRIDFDAILANFERTQRVLDELQELEDEDIVMRLL